MKLKELEKRLEQEPGNLGLRVQVAGLMREAGRSVEAVELYRSVASAYRDQGRTQQAVAVCRSILEIAPDDAACQGLLAILQAAPSVPSLRPPPSPSPSLRPPPSPSPSLRPPPSPSPSPRPPPASPPSSPEPGRRSSLDETPLPRPIPYHVSDPTSRPLKFSSGELDLPPVEGAETRPGGNDRPEAPSPTGLAQAARRISGLISESRGVPGYEMDLAAELETRQRPKVAPEDLRTLGRISATSPDLDDLTTPPPEDPATDPIARLTPPMRSSDDALTQPRARVEPDDDN